MQQATVNPVHLRWQCEQFYVSCTINWPAYVMPAYAAAAATQHMSAHGPAQSMLYGTQHILDLFVQAQPQHQTSQTRLTVTKHFP